jgi:ABC-type transport system involved in multi-copper enzyme maturation permease subunit
MGGGMRTAAKSERDIRAARQPILWLFLSQEYLRIMRGRLATLIWALLAYSLLAVPFIMAMPAPEVLQAIATWLGPEDAEEKLILFTWVDAAMNKFAVILGPVLAGGIIAEERARGTLDLLAAKPVGAGDYFSVKLAAAGEETVSVEDTTHARGRIALQRGAGKIMWRKVEVQTF